MPPTRRNLLAGMGAGLALPRVAAASPRGRKLVVVLAYGGWDTTFALDPKPGRADAGATEVRRFADLEIGVAPTRPSVDAFFERAADRTALIRGVSVRSLSHPQCVRRALTGDPRGLSPDAAALVASAHGGDRPAPYLVFGAGAYAGDLTGITVRTGTTNQLTALLDPGQAPWIEQAPAPAGDSADLDLVRGWLEDRSRDAPAFRKAIERAYALPPFARVFAPPREVSTFDDQVLQAADALSAGLTWSVALDSRLDFDTHALNAPQDGLHEALFEQLLRLLDVLELWPGEAAGSALLDECTVLVVSEMTRTPSFNDTGGKDHWPYATFLALGAGVRGGRAYGGTDEDGVGLPVAGAELLPENVIAGLLEHNGVSGGPGAEAFLDWLA